MEFLEARSALGGDLSTMKDRVHLLCEHLRTELRLPEVADSFEGSANRLCRMGEEVQRLTAREAPWRCEYIASYARGLADEIEETMEKVLGPMTSSRHVEVESHADVRLFFRGFWSGVWRFFRHLFPSFRRGYSETMLHLKQGWAQMIADFTLPGMPGKAPKKQIRPSASPTEIPTVPSSPRTEIPDNWLCSKCHYHLKGLVEKQRCEKCHKLNQAGATCEHCGGSLAYQRWVICPECGSEIALQVRRARGITKSAVETVRAVKKSADRLLAAAKAERKI